MIMAHQDLPQPDMPGVKLTTDDVISWCLQQAFNLGQIKFSTAWQPDKTIKSMPTAFNRPESPTTADHESDVQTAMEDGVKIWQREQEMFQLMRANRPLLIETEAVVHERLLAAGMSQETLKRYIAKKVGLRVKVADLYNLEHPEPKAPATVAVKVLTPARERGSEMMKQVYLPLKGSLADTEAVLRDVTATILDGSPTHLGHGPWLYQLTDKRSRPLAGATRVPLLTDANYQGMLREMTKKETATPSAILVQVGSPVVERVAPTANFKKGIHSAGKEERAGKSGRG